MRNVVASFFLSVIFIELFTFIFDFYYFKYCRTIEFSVDALLKQIVVNHSNMCNLLDTFHYKLKKLNVNNVLYAYKLYA